jgi:tagaturonate reductase
MFMSEVYRLWAIETSNERTKGILSFSKADKAVLISPDIEKFRELKLRLLNGSHTLSCGIGLLMGFSTVKQAMADKQFEAYIKGLMELEISPAICNQKISKQEAIAYGQSVLERFKNPFLDHQWLSITLQYSSKMKMRNVPILLKHYELTQEPPVYISAGFAAYILFMKSELNDKQQYTGMLAGRSYVINDDKAALLNTLWQTGPAEVVVKHILQEKELWGTDLSLLPGFHNAVTTSLLAIKNNGIASSIQHITIQQNNKQALQP